MEGNKMKTIIENVERNARYTAYKNLGVVVEHGDPKKEGGFQWLSYRFKHKNNYYPDRDYITVAIDVVWHAGCNCFMVDAYAETPDRFRKQYGSCNLYKTYEEARENAIKEIDRFHSIIESEYWKEWQEINITADIWEEAKKWMKEEKADGTMLLRVLGQRYKVEQINGKLPNTEYFRVKIIN